MYVLRAFTKVTGYESWRSHWNSKEAREKPAVVGIGDDILQSCCLLGKVSWGRY